MRRLFCLMAGVFLLMVIGADAQQPKAIEKPTPSLESTREESLELQLLMSRMTSERNRLEALNAQIELAKQQAERIKDGIARLESEFPTKMNAVKKRLGIKETDFDKYDGRLKEETGVVIFAPKEEKKQ